MKISVDDVELYTLSETKKRVIQNDILSEEFDSDMRKRLEWVLMNKYEKCFERLKKEWEPKLVAGGAQSLPTDPDAFAEMVFNHPNYKNRSQRENEAVALRGNPN